jgi:uncharacterized protein (DUF362 family)
MASDEISRRKFLGVTITAAVAAGVGCSDDSGSQSTPNAGGVSGGGAAATSGGAPATSGGAPATSGGAPVTGGAAPATGGSAPATGGGAPATGGATTGTTPSSTGAEVALVRGTDVIQATIDAINAVGGFPDLTGKVVMLRPNAIDTASPGSTNPDVIRGVIRAIKAKGNPTSIIVADDTFTGGTIGRMTANGIKAAADAEGATCQGLEDGDFTPVAKAAAAAWSGTIDFYDAVVAADYVINIPVCKTHGNANFSMALKAWYGNTPTRNHNHNNVTTISNVMAEMHLVRQEDFVVLDATKCLLTGGPQVGSNTTASPGIVVATKDPIIADVTGLCIIKQYLETTGTTNTRITNTSVWEQPQIARAMALAMSGWISSKRTLNYSVQGLDATESASIMAFSS